MPESETRDAVRFRCLVVEDDRDFAELVRQVVVIGLGGEATLAYCVCGAQAQLQSASFDTCCSTTGSRTDPGLPCIPRSLDGIARRPCRRLAPSAANPRTTPARRQAALIDKARDLIVVTDLQGGILYANPSGARVFQCRAGPRLQAGSSPTTSRAIDLPGFDEIRTSVLKTNEWSGTVDLRQGPEPGHLLETRWTLIHDDLGRPDSILLIGTDITERRRLESEFLRAQKWEAVGSLAGGMAHDLNNTLAPALLGLEILHKSGLEPATRRLLAMIESRIRRGTETVQQVLQFLRRGDVAVAEVDPATLMRELEKVLQETLPRNIRIVTLLAPEVGRIRGNVTQLHHALLNLCLNARDAMPAGGQLTLAVDDVDLAPEEASALPDGGPGEYVLIAVSDSGSGMSPEVRDRIFDPLFTTKPEGAGTGLGLTSVATVVRHHGGLSPSRAISARVQPLNCTFRVLDPGEMNPALEALSWEGHALSSTNATTSRSH